MGRTLADEVHMSDFTKAGLSVAPPTPMHAHEAEVKIHQKTMNSECVRRGDVKLDKHNGDFD